MNSHRSLIRSSLLIVIYIFLSEQLESQKPKGEIEIFSEKGLKKFMNQVNKHEIDPVTEINEITREKVKNKKKSEVIKYIDSKFNLGRKLLGITPTSNSSSDETGNLKASLNDTWKNNFTGKVRIENEKYETSFKEKYDKIGSWDGQKGWFYPETVRKTMNSFQEFLNNVQKHIVPKIEEKGLQNIYKASDNIYEKGIDNSKRRTNVVINHELSPDDRKKIFANVGSLYSKFSKIITDYNNIQISKESIAYYPLRTINQNNKNQHESISLNNKEKASKETWDGDSPIKNDRKLWRDSNHNIPESKLSSYYEILIPNPTSYWNYVIRYWKYPDTFKTPQLSARDWNSWFSFPNKKSVRNDEGNQYPLPLMRNHRYMGNDNVYSQIINDNEGSKNIEPFMNYNEWDNLRNPMNPKHHEHYNKRNNFETSDVWNVHENLNTWNNGFPNENPQYYDPRLSYTHEDIYNNQPMTNQPNEEIGSDYEINDYVQPHYVYHKSIRDRPLATVNEKPRTFGFWWNTGEKKWTYSKSNTTKYFEGSSVKTNITDMKTLFSCDESQTDDSLCSKPNSSGHTVSTEKPQQDSNLSMSKKFERGASKSKRKRIQNDTVKTLMPITAFMHQPLVEATNASGEVDTLILTQGNQSGEVIQPTISIPQEKNLSDKVTVKQNAEGSSHEVETMMSAQNENIKINHESFTGQGEDKESQENNMDSQNFQLTPDVNKIVVATNIIQGDVRLKLESPTEETKLIQDDERKTTKYKEVKPSSKPKLAAFTE